ncbi:MAG TPA: LacI family DNA-binding transcriptional regulator [Nocardioides sp.]
MASKPRATMREVAALAGVSLKTVSRVINDEPAVSVDVRGRVLKAAEQLDYRHNMAASNLRRKVGRTRVVGALLQDLGNSFSSSLLRALEDAAREHQTAILAASLDEEPDRELALVADLVSRRVDGLVIMPASDRQDYLDIERRAGLPTVFVDRRPRGIDADSVTVDNVAGAREATEHLIRQGHRRIAVLSDRSSIQTAALRLDGVLAALATAGLESRPDLVATELRSVEAAEEALLAMLSRPEPPTAVVALRNILSVGCMRALRRAGLTGKVAVVGFDDFPMADLMDLTVIRQNVSEIGATAARLLFDRLGGDQSAPQHIVVEHQLVQRGSGEIAPAY